MALKGATYALPMVTFDITVTRTLTDCDTQVELPPAIAGGKNGEKLAIWQGGPRISIAGEAKAKTVPGEAYRYDPAKLVAWSKTTNFNMTYQKGTNLLKGINSSIDDQTGPILADVVATGLAVASVVAGPGWLAGASAIVGTLTANPLEDKVQAAPAMALSKETDRTRKADAIDKIGIAQRRAAKIEQLRKLIQESSLHQSQVICTDKARKLQADLKAAEMKKEDLATQAKAEARTIDALLAAARIRPLSRKQRGELEALVLKLDGILRQADDQQTIIDDSKNALSITSKETWPKTFDEKNLTLITKIDPTKDNKFNGLLTIAAADRRLLSPSLLAAELAKTEYAKLREEFTDWAATYVWPDGRVRFTVENENTIEKGCRSGTKNDPGVTVPKCLATLLPIAVEITNMTVYEPDKCTATPSGKACMKESDEGAIGARDAKADKGLFYRTPVPGQLKLCRATTDAAPTCIEGTNSIIQKEIVVPQLGQLRFLPLNNDIFENTGLIANFDENGAMTDVSFVTSKAAGASLAANTAKVAASLKTAKDEDKKQVEADEDRLAAKAETKAKADDAAAAKKKADEAEAEAKLKADKEAADTATRTAMEKLAKDLRAEAELANARLAAIIATRCLDVADQTDGVPTKCPAN